MMDGKLEQAFVSKKLMYTNLVLGKEKLKKSLKYQPVSINQRKS
jgi:hypothetical protein